MSKNVFRNRFRDGYTYKGYIAAVPRLHDELRFEFRYFLTEEVEALEKAAALKPAKQAVQLFAAAMADGKLLQWSEVDEDGKPVPVSVDAVRHLPNVLFNRLYRILAGRDPYELDPLGSGADGHAQLTAELDDKAPGEALLEASAKN